MMYNSKPFEDEKTIFLNAGADEYAGSTIKLLKYTVNERGMGGVYITIAKPYEHLIEEMDKQGINSEHLYFIDCGSDDVGVGRTEVENCVFSTPNQSKIMMEVNSLLKKVKTKNKFILLDCISTLLVYNNEKSVRDFTMWLMSDVRLSGDVIGILVTIKEDTPPTLVGFLKAMSEKVIEL